MRSMPPNPYDQVCRYLLKLSPVPLLAWLLRLAPGGVEFAEWLDARQVPWPGQPDRYCDTVAHLRDPKRGGVPWAVVVEFQVDPDELMFGRGLAYLGELWQACKPTEHRGDRFHVGLVVVNLRGVGKTSRTMRLSDTRLGTALSVVEWNLSKLRAGHVLKQVEAGEVPRAALAWVPLFKGGGRPGIIPEWKRLASQETDVEMRRALGLMVIFAEAAGCGQIWREALKGWNMIESKIVNEWISTASSRMLLKALKARFQDVPEEIVNTIQACTDPIKFDRWMEQAVLAPTIEDFRRALNED
jgi:hypothetical protein